MKKNELFQTDDKKKILYCHVNGGGVPGGHNCIYAEGKKPFITPMKECNSISLRHSDVVVDIGAYVGTYSIRCARFPVKKVIAYEPTKVTFDILNLTKLSNLKVINAAIVGDDKTEVKFYISKGIGVTNSTLFSKVKLLNKVKAVNYKKAIEEASIVKIDIEGGEYSIPIDDLVHAKLRGMIIDFHPVKRDWIEKATLMINKIEDLGFINIIKPNWANGWTRAGSWLRNIDTTGEHKSMMSGKECCGCGHKINGNTKSICNECSELWSKKHKETYTIVNRIGDS